MFRYTSLYFDNPPQKERAVDIWIPDKVTRPVVMCFVHGGGWRQGHREHMHSIMHGFYEQGYPCISVDYRLGKARIPVQLEDVRTGMALAAAHLRQHGFSLPFVIYGSSAGGHLALLAGLAPGGVCGEIIRHEAPSIAGIVASCAPVTLEPWEDIFPGSRDAMQEAAGIAYDESPELYRRYSPEQYANKDSPPLFFILGECEHMFPNALTIALVRRLQSRGGSADYRIYPAGEHGFFHALHRRSQQMAFQDMLTFLEALREKS